MILRVLYLLVILAGLGVSMAELQHALWLYRELKARKINGVRQMLVTHFIHEEQLRVAIQAVLVVPGVTGVLLLGSRFDCLMTYRGLLLWAQLAHLAVAVLLLIKAVSNRRARHVIGSALTATELFQGRTTP